MKRNLVATDHYDPKKDIFKNPYSQQAKGLWQVIKWKWSSSPAKWPRWYELKHSPQIKVPSKPNKINISFVGHSSFLIQTHKLNILTDPVWSHRVSPVSWAGPARHHAPGIKLENLPKIDVVILSHNHYDHMDLATLKILEDKFQPLILCPLGEKELLQEQGLTQVTELDWWQEKVLSGYRFVFTPAQHFSGRGLFDRFKSLWGSFVIQTPESKNIFFGGDTGYSKHFVDIFNRLGAMDFSLIPIGAYEPRWFMKTMHVNPSEAVMAHIDLKSKQSIGIHFGTFQLTDEAIDQPKRDLIKALEEKKISPDKFTTLQPGQSQIFSL